MWSCGHDGMVMQCDNAVVCIALLLWWDGNGVMVMMLLVYMAMVLG